ncbi:MAG: ATP-grasp domain-containing protein, partial [Planctomycetota bacterium]
WVEGEELTFDLLADPQGELRMACARRRLRVSAGISVAGEIVSSAPFLGLLERIVRGIPLPGPSCLQCNVGRDGEAMFTDLNPRLGGGVALALAGGTPILGGILAGLRGEPIRRSFDAGVGLRFLRKYDEVYLEPGASL